MTSPIIKEPLSEKDVDFFTKARRYLDLKKALEDSIELTARDHGFAIYIVHLGRLSLWVTAVSAASFVFLISHIGEAPKYISVGAFRNALWLFFVVSALGGLLRVMQTFVMGSHEGNKAYNAHHDGSVTIVNDLDNSFKKISPALGWQVSGPNPLVSDLMPKVAKNSFVSFRIAFVILLTLTVIQAIGLLGGYIYALANISI